MTDNVTISTLSNSASIAQIVAALGVMAAAIFTFRAANVHKKASTGATMISCLEQYTKVMEHKREAIEGNSISLAEWYYREIFDLLWSELHLWKDKVILDETIFAWLYIRRKQYDDDDTISVTLPGGKSQDIKYKDEWDKVITGHYYHPKDPYIDFMRRVHDGEITTLKKLKIYKRKLKVKYDG